MIMKPSFDDSSYKKRAADVECGLGSSPDEGRSIGMITC